MANLCRVVGCVDEADIAKSVQGEAASDWLVTIQAAHRIRRESNMTDDEWSHMHSVISQRHLKAWGKLPDL
jgi:hypothetical protein